MRRTIRSGGCGCGGACGLRLLLIVLSLFNAVLLQAADWPRFRGVNAEARTSESIRRLWPSTGLPIAWRFDTPGGHGGVAVSEGRAFLLALQASNGFARDQSCVALDAFTGAVLWSTVFKTNDSQSAPHSTPTVHEGRVFVYGPSLTLACLECTNGQVVWKRDLERDYSASRGTFENSQSPWVEEGRVFVSVVARTNCLMAFSEDDGALLWRGHTNALTYGSPVGVTIGGVRQIVFPDPYGLVAVAPDTGRLLWRHAQGKSEQQGASPVFQGNLGVCVLEDSSGAVGFRVDTDGEGFRTVNLWTNRMMWGTCATPIAVEDNLYLNQSLEGLTCLEFATGHVRWNQALMYRSLVLADGLLLGFSEGEHALLRVSDGGCEKLESATTPGRGFLNTPSVAYGRVYIRDEDGLVCYLASGTPEPLQLRATYLRTAKRMQITAWRRDGKPISSEQLPQLYRTFDWRMPIEQWTRVGVGFVVTNGMVQCEVVPRYFFTQAYFTLIQ